MDEAGKPLRILVVDDDDLSRSMMQILLSRHGHAVALASNGSEALEAIKTQDLDLVFMDLVLPDMNGREVCRQAREWEAGQRRVPIVALTGYNIPGQPLELLKAGMDDYIFKPYDVRQITRMIYLYAQKPRQALSGTEATGQPQQAAVSASVLDHKNALTDFSDHPQDYRSLLAEFIGGLPKRLERMQKDYDSEALTELAREAHNLKSVSASLGAMELSALAGELERYCNGRYVATSGQLLKQVARGVQSLQSEASEFLRS